MQHQMKSLVKLMHFIMKLKKRTLLSRRIVPTLGYTELDHDQWTPRDIKEGHFAVLAENERFVVGLKHLKNPEFLRLLDQAQEEYGFSHGGVLVVPCSSEELNKILGN